MSNLSQMFPSTASKPQKEATISIRVGPSCDMSSSSLPRLRATPEITTSSPLARRAGRHHMSKVPFIVRLVDGTPIVAPCRGMVESSERRRGQQV